MNLPPVSPVMLLQQCNVFPHGLLPLYIFEPRYRTMLDHALRNDRILCIGFLNPENDADAPETDDRIAPYSTASVIRACVGNEDGTSRLVLQGMQRVQFLSWEQYEPFRVARIQPVETSCGNRDRAARQSRILLKRVLALLNPAQDTGRQLIAQLQKLDDPELLVEFVAGNLIRHPASRQPLLGMGEVGDRLDYLLEILPASGEKPVGL